MKHSVCFQHGWRWLWNLTERAGLSRAELPLILSALSQLDLLEYEALWKERITCLSLMRGACSGIRQYHYFHCCVIFRGGQFISPDPTCDICHMDVGGCKQLNLEVAAHSAAGGVTWHELLHSLWPGSHKGWKEFIEMIMPLIYCNSRECVEDFGAKLYLVSWYDPRRQCA